MNKLTRISATVASSVALVAGFAGVASAAQTIDRTGYSSDNRITERHDARTRVQNNNDLRLKNNNPQTAVSGDVDASRNTTVEGEVMSGEAANDSFVEAMVHVDNSAPAAAAVGTGAGAGGAASAASDASISQTGAESLNRISSEHSVRTTVENNNSVHVNNNNKQTAVSGNVSADRNTTVGDVSSGPASNVSTATFEVSVSN